MPGQMAASSRRIYDVVNVPALPRANSNPAEGFRAPSDHRPLKNFAIPCSKVVAEQTQASAWRQCTFCGKDTGHFVVRKGQEMVPGLPARHVKLQGSTALPTGKTLNRLYEPTDVAFLQYQEAHRTRRAPRFQNQMSQGQTEDLWLPAASTRNGTRVLSYVCARRLSHLLDGECRWHAQGAHNNPTHPARPIPARQGTGQVRIHVSGSTRCSMLLTMRIKADFNRCGCRLVAARQCSGARGGRWKNDRAFRKLRLSETRRCDRESGRPTKFWHTYRLPAPSGLYRQIRDEAAKSMPAAKFGETLHNAARCFWKLEPCDEPKGDATTAIRSGDMGHMGRGGYTKMSERKRHDPGSRFNVLSEEIESPVSHPGNSESTAAPR